MAILGPILKQLVKTRKNRHDQRKTYTYNDQVRVLKKLISKARNTDFGQTFGFTAILEAEDMVQAFQSQVPLFDYESLYTNWWYRTLNDEENVTWPGKVKYYALTSGTSQASSKKIPITPDIIRAIRRVGLRHSLALTEMGLPPSFYETDILMLAGSSKLIREDEHFVGDLSGILTKKLPLWSQKFYKPGRRIGNIRDWGVKLEKMIENAQDWNIGVISGNPAWLQILMEEIIERYKVENIHQVWPNLRLFLHGGVSIKPYMGRFEKIFGKEVFYLETYLASEGFLATQSAIHSPMRLVVDTGIFFEFIPFNNQNFGPEGNLLPNPQVLSLKDVKDREEYALLISTSAGIWRYMIGDTVRIHSAEKFEISITGRTKHFLSLCGEHLSVENMTEAVARLSKQLKVDINEFTVVGLPHKALFAHKWYIAADKSVNPEQVKVLLDNNLKELNDDYAVERRHALKEIMVEILPHEAFYQWLKQMGKEGGQHKFPRVLKTDQYASWEEFIRSWKKT
jgi:hypothetical protein